MPRFFMHLLTPSGLIRDERGRELGDFDEARRKATDALRHIVAADPSVVRGTFYEIESEDLQLRLLVAASEVTLTPQPQTSSDPELGNLHATFSQAWPVDGEQLFDDLLRAIDTADATSQDKQTTEGLSGGYHPGAEDYG